MQNGDVVDADEGEDCPHEDVINPRGARPVCVDCGAVLDETELGEAQR